MTLRLGRPGRRRPPARRLNLDLPTQLLDNALELLQSLDKLRFPLRRRFGRRIGIFGTGLSGRAAGRWKDTRNQSSTTIGAWHLLVAADFAAATGDTAPRVEGWTRTPGRGNGTCVSIGTGGLVDGDIGAVVRSRMIESSGMVLLVILRDG
jgi:hypothetical protein